MLKRIFLGLALLVTLSGAQAAKPGPLPLVLIYGPDPCLACMEWASHLMVHGFSVKFQATADMAALKRKFRVPAAVRSVLTARVGNYFIEGHVPAGDIKQLLLEKPRVRGLAVPGLPLGAPGFEGADPSCEAGCTVVDPSSGERESQRELFDTLLVGRDGKTSIYARH